jgi:hypothetical protein
MNNKELTKVCSKCKENKPLTEFYKSKSNKDKLCHECILCVKLYGKKWRFKHKKERSLYNKQLHEKNKEKNNLRRKQHYLAHKEERKIYDKKRRLKNKDKIRISNNKYKNQKYKNNTEHRLVCLSRTRMSWALKYQGVEKSLRTIDCLGCTIEFFQNYIKSNLKPGMTLENNGPRKWVLHHIRYCHTFDLKDPEQQKLCFNYTNVIPMWKDEHIILHANNII